MLLQELLPEVQGMAGICCDAVADSMRIVGQLRFSGTETKQALRAADRQLQALVRLSGWCVACCLGCITEPSFVVVGSAC